MSLKFPPQGSVHKNRIKPLPLSLPLSWNGRQGGRRCLLALCAGVGGGRGSALSTVQGGL